MKTTQRLCVAVLSLACVAMGAAAPSASSARTASAGFASLRLHLEVDLPSAAGWPRSGDLRAVDLLDLPAEIALEAISERPLRVLRLISPQGKQVMALRYARGAGLAGSELSFETEGDSLREVLARYPLGVYSVQGITMDGEAIAGSVELSGTFPGQFTAGLAGNARQVPIHAAVLSWSAAHSAAGYELEIESESLDASFTVRLPSTATSFSIPAQLLVPGVTYEYSLSVRGDTDNELEVEGQFTTVP